MARASFAVAWLLWFFVALVGCKPKTDPGAPPKPLWPDDGPSRTPDSVVSGDAFAFGTANQEGLSVGLRVASSTIAKGEPIRYWIAMQNRGRTTATRRWFEDNDFVYPRTKLVAVRANGGVETVGRAVGWNDVSSAGFGIDVALAPGETKERQGNLFPFPPTIEGGVDLKIVFGGPPYKFVLESGRVHVDVAPSP